MQFNKAKFILTLKNIEYPLNSVKRSCNTMYNNNMVTYWNNLLWNQILDDSDLIGRSIDFYEFYNFCGYYCNYHDANKIFKSINTKSRSIYFKEFEDYLQKIDDKDYIEILKCLNIYNTEIQSDTELEELSETELEELSETELEELSEPELEELSEPELELESEIELEELSEQELEELSEPELEELSEPELELEPEIEMQEIKLEEKKEKYIFLKLYTNLNSFFNKLKKIFGNF